MTSSRKLSHKPEMSHTVLYVNFRKHWEPRPLDSMVSEARLTLEVVDSTYLTFASPEVAERLIEMIQKGVEEWRRRRTRRVPGKEG